MAQEPSANPWWRRALRVGLLSFVLAAVVSSVADVALNSVPAVVAFLGVLLLIVTGIAFDILGTAVTAAEQAPLHAMAAKRVSGSRQAIYLVRNADKVANFANDVIGDVTGAVSGAAGTSVAVGLIQMTGGGPVADRLIPLALIGLIAGLTVGGKAAGKSFAMRRATDVVFMAGRIIYAAERVTGRSFTGGRSSGSSRRRST